MSEMAKFSGIDGSLARPTPAGDGPLLELGDLRVVIESKARGRVAAVDGVDLRLHRGQTVGLVGESGSGKSMICKAVLRLEPPNAKLQGTVSFGGKNLAVASKAEMRQVRGRRIAMMFQDPMTCLDPAMTIGAQLAETIRTNSRIGRRALEREMVHLLTQMRISLPEQRLRQYPHQCSGGTRQRIAGAMVLACNPEVVLADEPTTALDVTIQAHFLRTVKAIQRERGFAMVLVTHDLSLVRHTCDRLAVMYAGRIVEQGGTEDVLTRPTHPYTKALLDCRLGADAGERLVAIPGHPPDAARYPEGCRFAARCPRRTSECSETYPATVRAHSEGEVACLHPLV